MKKQALMPVGLMLCMAIFANTQLSAQQATAPVELAEKINLEKEDPDGGELEPVDPPGGLDDTEENIHNRTVLCPNPGNGVIYVKNVSEKGEFFYVYSLSGSMLHTLYVDYQNPILDLGYLKRGIYLIKSDTGVIKYSKI